MSAADPIAACLEGRLSPELAVARLLLRGDDATAIRRAVRHARDDGAAWQDLSRLVRGVRLESLQRMLAVAGIDHAETVSPASIAAMFDRAVAVSPEASVALYSLGDADRLAAATREIVAWLRDAALLGPDRDVLDLGCGIGRVAAALAGDVRQVFGIDVAAGMIAQARARCAAIPNVAFSVTDGTGLAAVVDGACDLILAVDSFPYLVQAGVAAQHVADAARVLRPAGSLVVLNLSSRADAAADRDDAQRWAARYGLHLDPCGVTPFARWDARVWGFARPP